MCHKTGLVFVFLFFLIVEIIGLSYFILIFCTILKCAALLSSMDLKCLTKVTITNGTLVCWTKTNTN